ncbi:MAG: branched-chain amino acid ABC transporter substrate-binding protein [Angustibacter sp.]
MRRRRLARLPLVAAASAALLLTACGNGLLSEDKAGDSSSGPILLGMLAPMSGSSAAIGPYMKNGAQLAISEINAKGGVAGRKLELRVEDDACDAKTATAGANKLVTQGVKVSVGGYCSGATLPTLPIFAKAEVPMLIPAANSNELVDQHLPNVFLLNGTGTQQADAALAYLTKVQSARVAVMDDNTSYSKDIADLTVERLKRAGGPELAGRDSVTPGESDYSANVTAVLKTKPDTIYWTGYFQEGGLIIRQLRQAGYQGKILVADGSVDAKLIEIAGAKSAEGVLATMTPTPETIESAKGWIQSYKSTFNSDPGPYSTQSYDAVRVAAEAIRAAGSTDGKAVDKALESLKDFPTFAGPLTFTKDHTLSQGGFLILKVSDGHFVLEDSLQ